MKLEPHLSIADHAVRGLLRKPFKHLVVLLVFATTVFLLTTVLLTTDAIEREATASLATAPDVTVQGLTAGRQVPMHLSGERLDEVRSWPGVESVDPRVWGHYWAGGRSTMLVIYGVEPPTDLPLDSALAEGRNLESAGEALIGAGVARRTSKEPGEPLWLLRPDESGGAELRVVGTFTHESSVLTNDLVVTSEWDARAFFDMEKNSYTDVAVHLHNPNEIDNVAEKLQNAFPGSRIRTRQDIRSAYASTLGWRSGLYLATLLGAIAAFLVLAWNRSVSLSGEERREIGVLRACGWSTSQVLELKLIEGLALSLTAFLAGAAASYFYVAALGAPLFTRLLAGWSAVYPRFNLSPHLGLEPLLPVFALSVIPFMAATLVPSWRAATIDPEEVMRGG